MTEVEELGYFNGTENLLVLLKTPTETESDL